jgi:hypothetical protein
MRGNMRDLKVRVTVLGDAATDVHRRLDRSEVRLDRGERRLDLTDAVER